jgi:Polyketide synthase modules and related proteins
MHVDWNKLYGVIKPKRISLPTYPFEKERYWIKDIDIQVNNEKPKICSNTRTETPSQLMTFEEYWEEKHLPVAVDKQIKTVICFLNQSDNKNSVQLYFQKASPETEIIFISHSNINKKIYKK